MKEFEGVDVVLDIDHRTIERQRVVDDILQGIRIHILAKESIGHRVGNLLERHLVDVVEEFLGQLVDTLWHIKSTIFCETFHNGLVQVSDRGLFIRTIVLHIFDYLTIYYLTIG